MSVSAAPVRWFATLGIADIPEVGGKNASLGEMASHLGAVGVQVPNGFALTASLYREALTAAGAWPRLHALLDTLDVTDVTALARTADAARTIVYDATRSSSLRGLIADAYAKLEAECGAGVAVAVRSSATAEDLPTASFAGQHDSYLNISGLDDVVEACRRCFASLFTDRAVVYRVNNGFDHFKVALSVGVMKMVRSDRAASGVIPRSAMRFLKMQLL
jgi:pyruvate,water dikinase